jgi:DUF4097 and DUF4098 domain-containing protein YvlB
MTAGNRRSGVTGVVLLIAAVSFAAEKRNEFRYNVAPGATITVVNQFGPISVQPSSGSQVVITATTHSDKVEVDCNQNGNRVEARTHILQHAGDDEARVEYQLQIPAGATISIRSATGALSAQSLQGDVSVLGDSTPVDIRGLKNSHLQVRTVNGPVTITNVAGSYVDVSSVSGPITLNNVSGPKVTANSSDGAIRYIGDPGANGTYSLMNHAGNIEVTLPADASVDLTARSVSGSVQNDFPLRPKTHTNFAPIEGRTLSGLANAGASSLHLTSFSGTITVKKQ